MKILALLILLCNVIALILVIVYHIVNNKLVKEQERRLKSIYKLCDDTLYQLLDTCYDYNKMDEEKMIYILSDIVNIIERGRHLWVKELILIKN